MGSRTFLSRRVSTAAHRSRSMVCCDEAYMGFMLNGYCFRFSCCTFGHRTSTARRRSSPTPPSSMPLSASPSTAPAMSTISSSYTTSRRTRCAGFAGGCEPRTCRAAEQFAKVDEHSTHELLDDLNMNSNNKGQPLGRGRLGCTSEP